MKETADAIPRGVSKVGDEKRATRGLAALTVRNGRVSFPLPASGLRTPSKGKLTPFSRPLSKRSHWTAGGSSRCSSTYLSSWSGPRMATYTPLLQHGSLRRQRAWAETHRSAALKRGLEPTGKSLTDELARYDSGRCIVMAWRFGLFGLVLVAAGYGQQAGRADNAARAATTCDSIQADLRIGDLDHALSS